MLFGRGGQFLFELSFSEAPLSLDVAYLSLQGVNTLLSLLLPGDARLLLAQQLTLAAGELLTHPPDLFLQRLSFVLCDCKLLSQFFDAFCLKALHSFYLFGEFLLCQGELAILLQLCFLPCLLELRFLGRLQRMQLGLKVTLASLELGIFLFQLAAIFVRKVKQLL